MLLPMAVLPGVLPVDLSPCPPDVWKIEFANSAPALCTSREGNGETVHQLQLAIQEHALRVANLTSAATIGGRRLGSNILGRQGSLTLVQFLHIRFAPGIGTQHTVRTTSCAPKSLASKSNNPKPDARISLRNLLQFFPRGGSSKVRHPSGEVGER